MKIEKEDPFIGKAGKLLDMVLKYVGLSRKDVFISNILHCKPPSNRNPTYEEIETCTTYLDRQLAVIDPKVVCCLGSFSSEYILKRFGKTPAKAMKRIRGEKYAVKGMNGNGTMYIIPCYHPASFLHGHDKEKLKCIKEDIKTVSEFAYGKNDSKQSVVDL